jgi:PBP1b-binding outer membrane lipoprotein LpoB
MKKLTIVMAFALLMIITGCSSQADSSMAAKASEVDTKGLIADTQEILETAEDVYRSGREYTAEEKSVINAYEVDYGDIEETDVKLLVNSALMVIYDAKRLNGVEDTFAKDLSYVKTLIDDIEKGAPLE